MTEGPAVAAPGQISHLHLITSSPKGPRPMFSPFCCAVTCVIPQFIALRVVSVHHTRLWRSLPPPVVLCVLLLKAYCPATISSKPKFGTSPNPFVSTLLRLTDSPQPIWATFKETLIINVHLQLLLNSLLAPRCIMIFISPRAGK